MSGARRSARDLVDTVLASGSFRSWDEPLAVRGDAVYREELLRARAATGVDESIITGEGRVGGHRVAVIVSEFGFLGGSIGVDAARRVAEAFTRATRERLPVLAAPASGGTRMQEGTVAFVQMITITEALERHRRAGLPYLVYVRHPTTGGVFASWGSLGQVTAAEPNAMIGFLGPRVYEAINGTAFPDGIQRAEHLHAHGLVDAVIDARHLSSLTSDVLDAWRSRGPSSAAEPTDTRPPAPSDDWLAVERSRDASRPGLRSLLRHSTLRPVRLSGTGRGEADPSLTLAIARFGGHGVVVLGHDRRAGRTPALTPGGLRVAARGIRLASELSLPLVTVIDTAGAELSPAAEEGGLAGEIARCLLALIAAPVPTVSILLGQGAGGGALALLPADRILAADDAWLSPLPPEGASAIVHRDVSRAPELARSQRIGAAHLLEDGVIDGVFDSSDLGASAASAIAAAIRELTGQTPLDRMRHRRRRFDGLAPTGARAS